MSTRTVRFMCSACNGTGKSRWHEGRDCDQCDGFGTIAGTLTLTTSAPDDSVLGHCPHGVNLDREFCPKGCRV